MLLSALLLAVRCSYLEITKDNVAQTIGGSSPVFVKFYSETCGHCRAMAEDFAEAAAAFGTNLTFGGVECSAQHDICQSHDVHGYPTIKLFLPGNTTGIDFSGARTLDGFCDFVEKHTTVRATRPARYTVDLHPLNFNETINTSSCVIVTFWAPWCMHCKHFLPQFKLAAKAFVPDNVTFGLVNCDEYKDLCNVYVEGYPTVRLFANGNVHEFTGARTVDAQATFVNTHCGTQRGGDGLLTNSAGLIEAASEIAQELINATDPAPYVEKLRAIPGAEFYVKAAERFVAKGIDQLTRDMATIAGILAAQRGSWTVLDTLKKRYNTFGEFFPRVVFETPTPLPTPATPEAAAAATEAAEATATPPLQNGEGL